MRAIKEELGDNDDDEDDVAALERKMQTAGMPSTIWKHAQKELRYVFLRKRDKRSGLKIAGHIMCLCGYGSNFFHQI